MAHNLNYNTQTKKYSIFTSAASWHNLEEEVSLVSKSEEVIKLAGLDYEVLKVPIQACIDEECKNVEGKWATVRKDLKVPLGVVGDRYTVLQNKDAFEFIDTIIGKKEAIFHSAGALGKGERIWLCAKLPQQCVVGLNDVVDNYFFLSNSHDGSKAVEIGFSQVMIVCENTLNMALNGAKRKKGVRHTTSMNNNLLLTTDLMGITRAKIDTLNQVYNRMTTVKIDDKQLRKFIEMAMKPEIEQISPDDYSTRFKNQVDGILEYSLGDSTQTIVDRQGNLWGAFNGITGYYNNKVEYDNAEHKLKQIMYGNANTVSERALNMAIDILDNKLQLV